MWGPKIHASRDVEKVYKEMVKEMNIIALQEESSQQQRASEVSKH